MFPHVRKSPVKTPVNTCSSVDQGIYSDNYELPHDFFQQPYYQPIDVPSDAQFPPPAPPPPCLRGENRWSSMNYENRRIPQNWDDYRPGNRRTPEKLIYFDNLLLDVVNQNHLIDSQKEFFDST